MAKKLYELQPNEVVAEASDLTEKANSTALASDWVSGATYAKDAHVTYNGLAYKRLVAGAGTTTPDLDTTNWQSVAVYDNPDYRMLADGNALKIADASGDIVWGDEYKMDSSASTSAVTLARNGMRWLDLSGNTTASAAVAVTEPVGTADYSEDMVLYVTVPMTVGQSGGVDVTSFMPISFTTTKTLAWMNTDPFALLTSASDLGKTFVFTFTELPDNTILVGRNELKGVPVITSTALVAAAGQTLSGKFLYGATAVQYSTDGTTFTDFTYAVSNDRAIVIDASVLTAGTVYTVRVTTPNGSVDTSFTPTAP